MKKKFIAFFLFIMLLSHITSCDKNENSLSTPVFSEAFTTVKESDPELTDKQIQSIISKLPSEQYEQYPFLHCVPLSASLYKNGKIISIDINDPRLIKLCNLYNNSVYYNQYAYTQGLLDWSYLQEHILNEDFRLELKFKPTVESTSLVYDTCITMYDTIIVTNTYMGFVLIANDLPGYEGEEDMYPVKSVGHSPLFESYRWLDLFGF